MFFRYSQINVNGRFIGPQIVIVEAEGLAEAESIAAGAGVYFDGVESGRDCECCGDRWTRFADEYSSREEAVASIESDRRPEGDSPVYQLIERVAG